MVEDRVVRLRDIGQLRRQRACRTAVVAIDRREGGRQNPPPRQRSAAAVHAEKPRLLPRLPDTGEELLERGRGRVDHQFLRRESAAQRAADPAVERIAGGEKDGMPAPGAFRHRVEVGQPRRVERDPFGAAVAGQPFEQPPAAADGVGGAQQAERDFVPRRAVDADDMDGIHSRSPFSL